MRPAAALAFLSTALLLPAAGACGLHASLPDGFKASHPASLPVSFALQDAYAAKRLTPAQALPAEMALLRATHLVRRFAAVLVETGHAPMAPGAGSVAVLLVEHGLWARYSQGAGGVQIDPHVEGPLEGEAVIVTGEAVLGAVLKGELRPQEARELGLMVVALGR